MVGFSRVFHDAAIAGMAATLFVGIPAANAATTVYTDKTAFQSSVLNTWTDIFSGYTNGLSEEFTDAQMSAIKSETDFKATGFTDTNRILDRGDGDHYYCAGCNGSFLISFDSTSFTVNGGVSAVGFDYGNGVFTGGTNDFTPSSAFVTFTDGSTANYLLPLTTTPFWNGTYSNPTDQFFGITTDIGIASIHLADNNVAFHDEGEPLSRYIYIDNLTIGEAYLPGAVPEPSTWAMMIGGFGFVGGAMRRRKACSLSFA